MDNNRFKQSQNFDNLESNKANNPGYKTESYTQQVQDYIKEMRSKNEEATHEGFISKVKNDSPPEAWENQEKAYNDAWEQHKNSELDGE